MEDEDEQLQKLEAELKDLENIDIGTSSGYGSPSPEKKDNILKLFRDMISSKDSRKIANLSTTELGHAKLGVRHLLEIANYASSEGLDMVSKYLTDKAEIVLATSMSKQGWFGNLVVTQIKKEQKLKEPKQLKKGLFGRKEEENEGQ